MKVYVDIILNQKISPVRQLYFIYDFLSQNTHKFKICVIVYFRKHLSACPITKYFYFFFLEKKYLLQTIPENP